MALIRPQPSRMPVGPSRRPTRLPAWVLVAVALHFGLFAAYSLVMGSLAQFVEQEPWAAFRWGALTAGTTLLLLVCQPIVDRLGARRPSRANAEVAAWVTFLAVYGLAAFAAAGLRSVLAPWALGIPLDARQSGQFIAQLFFPLMAVMLVIEVYLSRRQARLDWLALSERLERDLARRRLELVALDDRLRREAAHHLHGEVQTRLFMAWSLIRMARAATNPETARAQLSQASTHLDVLGDHGLRQARELLGAADSNRPISERAADLVERFGTVLPIALEVDPRVSACEAQLDPECRRQAILLVEEALFNAFRHASPTWVKVSLRLATPEATHLVLSVEDDGAGFDLDRSGKGLGLSALRDDLERSGGRVEVSSQPGRGTRVTLQLPIGDFLVVRPA